ncbi:MAG: hypothetical protein ACXABO_11675 [Promethearchaeota archaeon]|jgi:archaellum component FlaC
MSEEEFKEQELRDQINKIAVEIENIEQTAKRKETYIASKLEEKFNPKINELELKLQNQQAILNELTAKINGLISEKKELMSAIKTLEKECNTLKQSKEKALSENLKAIVKERKSKTKAVDKDIKLLEKELKSDKKK